jgi:release factor glutamine methyltransferase
MTLKEWLGLAFRQMRAAGELEPRNECELMAAAVLKRNRTSIIAHDSDILSDPNLERLNQALVRRRNGEPLAYIVGEKSFFKSEFKVGPGVLIPRPETEHLVEEALLRIKPGTLNIADFGAGSGCIGLSLLIEWPQAKLVAIENSPAAREYLKANIDALELLDRVRVDPESVRDFESTEPFDLIVANPPYVDEASFEIAANVKKFEPATALFAKENGLADIYDWIEVAHRHLKPGALLLMEIGKGQAEVLKSNPTLWVGWKSLEIKADLAGIDRVIIATR